MSVARPAHDREHDDQDLAAQQQEPGQPSGAQEVREDIDRQQRRQRTDGDPCEQIGEPVPSGHVHQCTSIRLAELFGVAGSCGMGASPTKYDLQAASSSSRVIVGSTPR